VKSNLVKRGFLSLVITQFFGAANDNLLKGVLSFGVATGGLWAARLGAGGQAYVGLCLTVPFIVLSGFAGQIADRYSKRTVIVAVKFAEVVIAMVGLVGFIFGEIWTAMVAMLLLAIQSAFFGPAKYGIIPELVGSRDLSRANGAINMFTNIAIIAGTLIAGPIYRWYSPTTSLEAGQSVSALPAAMSWAPGVAMLSIAILGLLASLFMPRLEPANPTLVLRMSVLGPYRDAIREMARGPLLLVALAWSFFYMVGMTAILILPDYKELLGVGPVKASVLLGILGIAIGIGSVAAGLISGHRVEARLIPVGAFGLTLFFLLLGATPLDYTLVAALLLGAGVFAGFYIIPLQALLQKLSPDAERGRFLGTANAISFVASTFGSLLFLGARQLGVPSNRVFLICGGLALVGIGLMLWRLRGLINDPTLRDENIESTQAV